MPDDLRALTDDRAVQLLADVAVLIPELREDLSNPPAFPADALAHLHRAGVLRAPLPRRHGGCGLGTEPAGALPLWHLLRGLGAASLSLGRLVEGHVNALQLVCHYGTEEQIAAAAAAASDGHLFAIWNTDDRTPVRSDGQRLTGRKTNISAAGHATRPLITVDHPEHSRLLLARLAPGEHAGPLPTRLLGMGGTGHGWADFTGYRHDPKDWIGTVGDYLREPVFSSGIWRTLAVHLGGIERLVDELRQQLDARNRAANPHQAARIAEALIAQETARLWTREAALLAEAVNAAAPEDIVGYANLARRAVEAAAFQVIECVERSLGLAALVQGNPVERFVADLTTYLRQPALDDALTDAARIFGHRPLPTDRERS